jgi:hypothetical protein
MAVKELSLAHFCLAHCVYVASLQNLLALGELNVSLELLYLLSGVTISHCLVRQARASFGAKRHKRSEQDKKHKRRE